jgi:hypothetical protein
LNLEKLKISDNLLRKNYYRSALPRSQGPSASLKKFHRYILNKNIKIHTVLDYGAGNRRDESFCLEHYGYYIPHDIARVFHINQPKEVLEKPYNLVIFNYILNILIPEDRSLIIDEIDKYLLKNSIILVSVRTVDDSREIKPSWIKYEDGWVTSRLTFQHFFSKLELFELFSKNAKEIINLGRGAIVLVPKVLKS